MSLSCECDFDIDDEPAFYIWGPTDYSTLATRRRKRCVSCEQPITPGTIVAPIRRTRSARTQVEERIYGEDDPEAITLAPAYLCEPCADIYFSLEELGFTCVSPYEDMRQMAREYHATYGPGKTGQNNEQD